MAGALTSGKAKKAVNLSNKKFALVVAEWNEDITEALFEGARTSLLAHGVKKKNIIRKNVPGSLS